MALISAPAPAAKAVVVGPGQMLGVSGCRRGFRLSGQVLLLPWLMVRSTTFFFLASWALPGWFVPPTPRDFGACEGEGEWADELSTNEQISLGRFPSSWLSLPTSGNEERMKCLCAGEILPKFMDSNTLHGGRQPISAQG